MFVSKKEGTIRFCADYRRLSAVIQRESYLIPRKDECIGLLGEDNVLSTLGADSGYYKMEIEDKQKDKTAFKCYQGLYGFAQIEFEFRNAPGTFTREKDVTYTR